MRPNGLTGLTLLLGVLNITGFFLIAHLEASWIAGAVVGRFIVLWSFWEGRNWARWLVLLNSVLTVFNLFLLRNATPLQGAVLVMETMLGFFLIYWLNTTAVREYFRNGGAALSS